MPTTAAGSIATVARWVLAAFMAVAGIGHFVSADTFLAQVPRGCRHPRQSSRSPG